MQLPEDPGRPVDRIILEAMAEGKFDHLEGHGKPLPVEPALDPRTAGFRVLKNAGFSPEWAELESAIERARLDADAALQRYDGRRQDARGEIEALLATWGQEAHARHEGWVARSLRVIGAGSGDSRPGALDARLAGAVDALNASRDRALASHLRRLHTMNRMIDRLNLIQPARGRERCREDVAREGHDLIGKYPRALLRRSAAGAPTIEWVTGELPAEWLQPPAADGEPATGRVRGLVQVEALVEYQRKHGEPA